MAKLIGSAPNQVPTNGDLGSMAFEDRNNYVTKTNPIYQPYRNLIINGDMSIAQRGTSVTGSTSSGYSTVDRWNFTRGGGATFSHSQTTDVPTGQGFANSYKIESTTGDGAMGASELNILIQLIEAQNLNSLKWGTSSAESITLSFWVKATVTGTYIVEFYNNDNAGDQLSASYTINSANTWEKKTITVVGYTSGTFGNDNLTGMQINWWLGAGSTYQSGSLTGTWRTYTEGNRAVGQVNTFENNNNTFYITGVQLEVGTSASDFEFLPYDVNYQRCIRYCNALLNYGAGDVNNNRVYNADYANGNGMARMSYPRMRNQPSITYTLVNATGLSNDFSSNGLIQLHAGDNNFYIHSILLEAEL